MTAIKKNILFILLIFITLTMYGHSGKARYHVIIDTDGGLDDLRAITLLLASKEVEVMAIHCSDGVLAPGQTAVKVKSLLAEYHHEGVAVGIGEEFIKDIPLMRQKLSKLSWGYTESDPALMVDDQFMLNIYLEEEEKITLVCLASLKAVADMQQTIGNFSARTEMILWFNEGGDIQSGLNYIFAPDAFEVLVKAEVPLMVVTDINETSPVLDDEFWLSANTIPSRYSAHLSSIHQSDYVKNELNIGREQMWDDLVALYLLEPGIFSLSNIPEYTYIKSISPAYPDSLSSYYLQLLNEKEPDYKVFNSIPEEAKYYAGDIAPVIQTIIEKHGLAEWRAGILTNELHGHIGIYAIIGMKMGLRAREYFNMGLDDLQIQSLAGQKPPVSCMNDGLQVSTGSSLGHGLIHAEESDKPYPAAIFIFKSQKIKINLKNEYTIMIRTEVQYAVENFSLGSENYWKYIRELAIKYWVELDRNKIFVINKIK